MNFSIFENFESNVRSYCRAFPNIFSSAQNAFIYSKEGERYIDFFSGAGSVNYGHNDSTMMEAVVSYIRNNGLLQGLDMHTEEKERFISTFQTKVLQPRNLNYKIQFTGPTGTNAVEAAIKLARKVTGRYTIACFTGGYHGMTLGSLSLTANSEKRLTTGVQIPGVLRLPYDKFSVQDVDHQLQFLKDVFDKPGSGYDLPAAFILECVQGEGGLNVASSMWLQGLSKIAENIGALIIVDDIQAGCGRTGSFFSFEEAGITPDIVCLSKSISGSGMPMSINLIAPHYDSWLPGEHNGTFRGNSLAMVTASVAIDKYWSDCKLSEKVTKNSNYLLNRMLSEIDPQITPYSVVGKGLMIGIKFENPYLAKNLSTKLFNKGLIIETCGPSSEVLKLMPPLTIPEGVLDEGFSMISKEISNLSNIAVSA